MFFSVNPGDGKQQHGGLLCCFAGVALGKCVEYGYTLARELAYFLESDGTAGRIVAPEGAQDEAFYEAEIPVTTRTRK